MMVLSQSKHYITIKFDFFEKEGVVKIKISEKNIITQLKKQHITKNFIIGKINSKIFTILTF